MKHQRQVVVARGSLDQVEHCTIDRERRPVLACLALEFTDHDAEVLASLGAGTVAPALVVALRSRLFFGLPLQQRVVQKGLHHARQGVLVAAQDLERELAALAEDALVAADAKGVNHVLSEAEGDLLRHLETSTLVKQHVKVDVDAIARALVQEQVFQVSISEPDQLK